MVSVYILLVGSITVVTTPQPAGCWQLESQDCSVPEPDHDRHNHHRPAPAQSTPHSRRKAGPGGGENRNNNLLRQSLYHSSSGLAVLNLTLMYCRGNTLIHFMTFCMISSRI